MPINLEQLTPPQKQISSAYIDGIKEGRNLLRANPDMTRTEMEMRLITLNVLCKNHSYAMKDFFKGERDFWKNQLKKT